MVCAMLAGLSFTLQKAAAVKAAMASSKRRQQEEETLKSIQEVSEEHDQEEHSTHSPSLQLPTETTGTTNCGNDLNDQRNENTTMVKSIVAVLSFINKKAIHTVEFLFFDIVGNLFFTLILPPLGSVSLYWPTFVAAKLILNAIVFGVVLKYEEIPKAVQVRTMIIACAVIYIPIVEPDFDGNASGDSDPIQELLQLENIIGLVWLILLICVFFIATGIIVFADLHKIPPGSFKETVLFFVFVGASILSGVAARISTYFSRVDLNDSSQTRGSMVVTFQIISWLFLLA